MRVRKIQEILIDLKSSNIKKENIIELLGYENNTPDEHVNDIIDDCLDTAGMALNPKGGIVFLKPGEISISKGKIYVDGETLQVDKIIASQLKNAEYIALFVCTIGKGVEELSKNMTERGSLLEGYILDLIGSEAAEETAAIIYDAIKAIVQKEKYSVSNSFSPGYCNWSVGEQFKIFSFFQESDFGIELTPSALMNPIKSISGIVGIGEQVIFRPYSCTSCDDRKCIYRNRKSHKV